MVTGEVLYIGLIALSILEYLGFWIMTLSILEYCNMGSHFNSHRFIFFKATNS